MSSFIYTTVFGGVYEWMAEQLSKSLSRFGYTLNVIGEKQITGTHLIELNDLNHKFKCPENIKLFHCRNKSGLDYLHIRIQPQHLLDLSKYDIIMYIDSDCLFFKDPKEIFGALKDKVYFMRDSSWKMKRHTGKLHNEFKQEHMRIRAANSGVFAFRPTQQNLDIMDQWAKIYLKYRNIEPRLQPSLNLVYTNNQDKCAELPFANGKDKREDSVLVHFIPWRLSTTMKKMSEHIKDM